MSEQQNKELPFYFLNELVLRTPALPFRYTLTPEMITSLLQDVKFMEALYLASPVLYAECIRLNNREITDVKEIKKIRLSLTKYYQRMYSRCTPFGLFSGCAVVKWGESDTGVVLPSGQFTRSTRLDMHYLCALGQHIAALPGISEQLLYYPNNSHYKMGEELRYIEYRYVKGRRIHQISSVLYSDYLQWVLDHARDGVKRGALEKMLVQQAEVEREEAAAFVEEMITSQVLISEMDPAITGDEFVHQLLHVLNRINSSGDERVTALIVQLKKMITSLEEIDKRTGQQPEVYLSLAEEIKTAGVSFEENKLFQVDMFGTPSQNIIQNTWQQEIAGAVTLLASVFPVTANETLTAFADRFRRRYEDRAVPLLQVLDAETGIGYAAQSGRNLSPLLENIAMPSGRDMESYDIKWNQTEDWLLQLLLQHRDKEEVVLEDKDIAVFKRTLPAFPPSMSVIFTLTEDGRIVFRGCSGSSAANLLGRFAHGSEAIHQLVKKITSAEQEKNDGVCFAEIIHLPEDRVGNILLHPAFREYEIPFLAQSSLPAAQQIALQDIVISVSQDKKIRLFSRKLNREIIPRLSNAHNYGYASLPVYHFLADLQTQGQSNGLAFNWGSMARQFPYLPRVRYGNTIIFEATWQLTAGDIAPLLAMKEWSQEVIAAFRLQWKMPRRMVLADGDNELLIDWESQPSAEAFISTVRGRDRLIVKEYPLPAAEITDEQQQPYSNQLVAILMNNGHVYAKNTPIALPGENMIQRRFLPGSEWIYYKIYCGSRTADDILLRCIGPLAEGMEAEQLIDKWFFIRYNDPDFHLRVRFHAVTEVAAGAIVLRFLHAIKELEEEGLIITVQADTYQRELERYGQELIRPGESLFYTDSRMKLEFLQLTEGDEREKVRWLWGLRCADEILRAFSIDIAGRYAIMQSFQQSFAAEFNADKALFRQLNQQYNEHRKDIALIMEDTATPANVYGELIAVFDRYRTALAQHAQVVLKTLTTVQQGEGLTGLLSGYIHMSLNRLFLSEPRQHELLVYDFLCTWYRSQLKRKA